MKLIDEWKSAFKMYSVQAMTLAITIQATWASLPDDWKATVPNGLITGITITCLILGVIGRLVTQDSPDNNTES